MLHQVILLVAVLALILGQHHTKTEARSAVRRRGIDAYSTVPGVGRFRLHVNPRSYDDAVLQCENEEAHLAVPTSKNVEDALLEILRSSNWLLAYVGVNDLAVEGRMVTVQGDLWSEVGYSKWEPGEPNNAFGNEDCVILTRNALLNDWNCSSSLGFFCEKNGLGVAAQEFVNSGDCGQPNAVNPLVVRGEATSRGEWPWMAAIFSAPETQFLCAGSLVSTRHVVTAAHCVVADFSTKTTKSPSSLVVHLGRYNLSQAEPYEQIIAIDELLVHPNYPTSKKNDHDVSVIVLKTAAVINVFVRTVCLWDNTLDTRPDQLVNKLGSVPGWGKDANGESAKDLRLARMPVVSQAECLESDTMFFGAVVSNMTFCAGFNNGTTLCNGDSGGGLFFYQENPKTHRKAWFVRGIVSLSKANDDSSCGTNNFVVFTDLTTVLGWIKPSLATTTPLAG